MAIPATSAQLMVSTVPLYKNTYDDKPSNNIKILNVIQKKTIKANEENYQFSLFFHNSVTVQKVSIVDEKATIEIWEEASHSDIQFSKKLLGEGGFGTVSKGLLQYKNGLQREVAVKTIFGLEDFYEESLDEEDFSIEEDFYSEVNALRILENQEHIVQFYFALHSESEFSYHIIMECGDIDLEEYIEFIKQHPEISINDKQLAKIGHDTFSGMLACLKFNIFNIDIKPRNYVMFFSQGIIKIIDFGIISPKKYLDDEILNTMITRTADSFIQCTFNKGNADDQESQNNLQDISFNSANHFPVSDEDKAYFKQHIPPYVNGNPLLLKLTQGIFRGDSNLLDITKTIEDIKEVGTQAPTDIRNML